VKGDTWCKFHVKAIWSPSLRKLTPTQRWIWQTLQALATEGDGVIHGAATEPSHIALASATDARGVPDALAKMQHLCLINVHKNGDIKIRNWLKYQSTTTERRKRKVRQIGGEKPAVKRQPAAPDKNRIDKNRIDNIKNIVDFWTSLPNLLQPRKITADDRKAVEFRLAEGAPVEEIESVLTWYNAQLGNGRTFWGGNNNDGRPIKYNVRKVMKGKLSDRLTYVYEHFLAAAKVEKPSAGPKTPEWQHKCPKAQAVRAGGHDCKKYEDWLVNPKKSSYPCNDCEEAECDSGK